MVEPAPFCIFKPYKLSEEEAAQRLGLKIPEYPPEVFKYIKFEDIVPDYYMITSYGRIFNAFGRELNRDIYVTHRNKTYWRIQLSCTTYIKRRYFYIHRLVANAFIPRTQEDIDMNRNMVNHIYDRSGLCNFVWNLEWVNDTENIMHSIHFNEPYDEALYNRSYIDDRDIPIYDQSGETHSRAKISEYQAHLICYARIVLGYSMKDCATYAWLDHSKSSMNAVGAIINGYSWREVGIQYGIEPKPTRKIHPTREPRRIELKDEYESMMINKKYELNE